MSHFPRFTQEFSPFFRLLDDYERGIFHPFLDSSLRTFSPKFDVKELKDSYELHGEFPGIEQKNISIEWTDANTLTITGRHDEVHEKDTGPSTIIEEGDPAITIEGKGHQPATAEVSKTPPQKVVKSDNKTKYWVSERSVGSFHRSFNFPARVDQEHVKASLKNGILSVVVLKVKKEAPRKVTIE